MTFEKFFPEHTEIVVSDKVQATYGTALLEATLEAGKTLLANAVPWSDKQYAKAGLAPRPGHGHEYPVAASKRIVSHDIGKSLSLDADSFMTGWALALMMGQCSSVREGSTSHYTHTFKPINPLTITTGTRYCLVTSIYTGINGPDATRPMQIVPDLAVASLTLSWRAREAVQLVVDMVGSGREDSSPDVTVPAFVAPVIFDTGGMKIEYGDRGGAYVDISDRIVQGSIRLNQVLQADLGYYPGTGLYRGRMCFQRRTFPIDLAIEANRANRDLQADMLAMTPKELRVTFDSGVALGGGMTGNHKLIVTYPDIQITAAPYNFDPSGATYQVTIGEDDVNFNADIATSPVTAVLDNLQAAYLAEEA